MLFTPQDPAYRYRTTGVLHRRLPSTAEEIAAWLPGSVFSAGFIQSYIRDLHPSFEDDDRIADEPFVLVNAMVASIPESEWAMCEETAAEYASMRTPFPPVVLTGKLSFVDGGHRHCAAILRRDLTIRAFIPASLARRQKGGVAGAISLHE